MFKVLANNTVVGVINEPSYVRYQVRNGKLISCDELYAQGVISDDGSTVWHLENRAVIPLDGFTTVTLVEIEEEEYNILKESLEANKVVVEPTLSENEQITLDFVVASKISQMKQQCSDTIINGLDIKLSDGNTYHFDLTLEDQVNILALKNELDSDAEQFSYHYAGGLCKYFTREDITTIINESEKFKNYHLVYFNSLKNYITKLKTISEVNDIVYGCKIPKKYQSEVLKELLS